jgi:hypothetical protein
MFLWRRTKADVEFAGYEKESGYGDRKRHPNHVPEPGVQARAGGSYSRAGQTGALPQLRDQHPHSRVEGKRRCRATCVGPSGVTERHRANKATSH